MEGEVVGISEGNDDGDIEGRDVDPAEGAVVGMVVGEDVGTSEGSDDGDIESRDVGPAEGTGVGKFDDGVIVGILEGNTLGNIVGNNEGVSVP
mmetsp:Transcript_12572/g.16536  ORF Transcript_12572/g.16536 Transcript_12572/m.16536 type:complete len:93 (+) Transcript_12572:191-469(+)